MLLYFDGISTYNNVKKRCPDSRNDLNECSNDVSFASRTRAEESYRGQ